jgi:hypothetical protein
MNREERRLAVRRNRELVFEFVETINRGDTEKLASMMADVFTFTDIEGAICVVRSLPERRKFWDDYIDDFPDYRITIERILSSGTDIAFIGKAVNSHLPRYFEVNETIVWYARVQDDKVSEWRIFSTEAYAF